MTCLNDSIFSLIQFAFVSNIREMKSVFCHLKTKFNSRAVRTAIIRITLKWVWKSANVNSVERRRPRSVKYFPCDFVSIPSTKPCSVSGLRRLNVTVATEEILRAASRQYNSNRMNMNETRFRSAWARFISIFISAFAMRITRIILKRLITPCCTADCLWKRSEKEWKTNFKISLYKSKRFRCLCQRCTREARVAFE